ncbi:CPED1-like protein [Mya arenaria]|uniref:CPED1-like protein n=1 Tax=Mya arenaria TaxID=6604 RepID=A0ABY7FUG4_MYAAR|nr:CPED1-like protein [Mya arenaria]
MFPCRRQAARSRPLLVLIAAVASFSLLLNIHLGYHGNLALHGPRLVTYDVSDNEDTRNQNDVMIKGFFEYTRDEYKFAESVMLSDTHNGGLADEKFVGESFPNRRRLNQQEYVQAGNKESLVDLRHRINKLEKSIRTHKAVAVLVPEGLNLPNVSTTAGGKPGGLQWVDRKTVVQGNWSVTLCPEGDACMHNCPGKGEKVLWVGLGATSNQRAADVLCRLAKTTRKKTGEDLLNLCSIYGGLHDHEKTAPQNDSHFVFRVQHRLDHHTSWQLPAPPVPFMTGHVIRMRVLAAPGPLPVYYVRPLLGVVPVTRGNIATEKSAQVPVEDALEWVSESQGLGAVSGWWRRLLALIQRSIRVVQQDGAEIGLICTRTFRLLDVDVICTTLNTCYMYDIREIDVSVHEVLLAMTSDVDVNDDLFAALSGSVLGDLQLPQRTGSAVSEETLVRVLDHFSRQDRRARSDIHYNAEISVTSEEDIYQNVDYSAVKCNEDSSDCGQIDSIHTEPPTEVQAVSAREYSLHVDFDVIVLRVHVSTQGCACRVILEEKHGSAGPRNITVGLGENRVAIYMVDTGGPEIKVVTMITLYIYRRQRVVDELVSTRLCAIKQDCSMRYDPESSCGYFPYTVQAHRAQCQSGDVPGQWVVPCGHCEKGSDCQWSRAEWRPDGCSYQKLPPQALRGCLAGRTLMFIGDSTNRGIAHYIIEQINGTLTALDKTHGIKTYSNVNDNRTKVTFAYYPHFWLPADHRPSFRKVLYQLIRSSLPIENSTDTVLVVGGVQWLARQHIDLIIESLQRKGLSGIEVIVKGLGAGFHQRVEAMRHVPARAHEALATREREVLSHAARSGLQVVATFNMTATRYRDFLEGKCACHFHKVTRLKSGAGGYTVQGEVNEAYSQILLNQMC